MPEQLNTPAVSRDLLEAFREELQVILDSREAIHEVLRHAIRDPYTLPNYDLLNDMHMFEHLGDRLVRGLTQVLETDLAETPERQAVASGA